MINVHLSALGTVKSVGVAVNKRLQDTVLPPTTHVCAGYEGGSFIRTRAPDLSVRHKFSKNLATFHPRT